MDSQKYQYEAVQVQVFEDGVAHIKLNRPKELNVFNDRLIQDVRSVFEQVATDNDIRVVVVSGSGKMFTAGLDLNETNVHHYNASVDPARASFVHRSVIKNFQAAFTAIEICDKPVIAAVHNACIGAGIDMITACDIRYCTKDSFFSVAEVNIGIAADVGTLQRLPKVIGNNSLVRELCFTARKMYAPEALACGFVNKVLNTQEELIEESFKIARLIASKSPVAVVGTKHILNYSRDHTVAEGLAYNTAWSSAMLNTEDLHKSLEAVLKKKTLNYAKL
ncbi:ClpP/crotonase-like domain-containing protein [Spinellus fusiger]|nr:ClpP/crotonase-like domain-containing protein [Spinellus fusiger]